MAPSSGQRLIQTLQGKVTDRPPFWFMRQAGRYLPEYRELRAKAGGFLAMCLNPDLATEITLQPLRRFDMDAAILFSDILIVPHALGCGLRFAEQQGPILTMPEQGVEELLAENNPAIVDPVFETVRRLRKELPPEKSLIGFAGAPWTVACYMIEGKGSKEFAAARQFAYGEPQRMQALLDLLVKATIDYLSKQIQAGADAIMLFDSWAGLVPPNHYDLLILHPQRRIFEALKKRHPNTPLIGFPKGALFMLQEYAETMPCDAMAIDAQVPFDWAVKHLLPHKVLQGNLDNMALVASKEETLRQADAILQAGRHVPFVFNLGHGCLPNTPVEHVAALSERIKNFRR